MTAITAFTDGFSPRDVIDAVHKAGFHAVEYTAKP
jgi:hypothetical protein